MTEFDYDELVTATDGFSTSRLIGKGSHGYVYKAFLHQDHKQHRIVAVKTPSSSSGGYESEKSEKLKKLENEINVLSSLPTSPYVLNFLGFAGENKVMVMEFMPNGSLHQFLHVSTSPPTWRYRLEIALQIARAVHFLHGEEILHRDIKSENVLLDSKWNAKLADFGLAVDSTEQTSPAPAGTMGYLDPCYTCPEKLTAKTDIYSYGVVLLEILTGRKAIDVSCSPAFIVDWAIPLIKNGKIKEIYSGEGLTGLEARTILQLLEMAARCVSSDAESRPCSGEIIAEIVLCLTEPRKSSALWISVLRAVVMLKRRGKWAKRLRESGRVKCRVGPVGLKYERFD